MKIAMLTNNYKPFVGGVPISIERLAKGLEMLGHEVYIFAPTYENQKDEHNVIRYKSFSKKLAGFIVVPNCFDKIIEKKLKELQIDIIHTHHPMAIGNIALHLGEKLNIPVVFTYHTRYEEYLHYLTCNNMTKIIGSKDTSLSKTYIRNNLLPRYIRSYANKCDLIFAPSNQIEKDLLKKGIVTPIKILPTGVPPEMFDVDRVYSKKIREHYIGDKKYMFCTVSRLSREKNIDFIINGLYKLKNEIGDIFNFIIIGDGPEKKKLEKLCKNLDLEENIFFVGEKPNSVIKEYQGASDLFLFASTSETQGIVLVEAMAAGLGVIAVKSPGVNDIVKDKFNGISTERNINEWVEAIEKVIFDKELRITIHNGAYETAKQYSCSSVALVAENFYNNVIKEKNNEEHGRKLYDYKFIKKSVNIWNRQIFKRS